MKVVVYLHAANHKPAVLEVYNEPHQLGEVITEILEHWHEDEGPQLFWLVNEETNEFLATMMRGEREEDAIVTMRDGTVSRFHVVYDLDTNGRYLRTIIKV
jgi:hypothetical protein